MTTTCDRLGTVVFDTLSGPINSAIGIDMQPIITFLEGKEGKMAHTHYSLLPTCE